MENKINAKITNGQYDKRNQNSRTKQMDKLLKEQYTAETKILETALLKAAGKSSWDEFLTESEEEIQEGYNRLITRLKENGEYREQLSGNRNLKTNEIEIPDTRENLDRYRYEWNRTHRFLKPAAVVAATVMITVLAGMSATADCQPLKDAVQGYHTVSAEKK